MKLDIIFENDEYVIINKPPNILSVPDRFDETIPSCIAILRKSYAELFIIHRIDRETSGVLCFAKTAEAHKYASLLFQHRQVEKKYLAFVVGKFSAKEGIIEAPIMEHPVKKGSMVVNKANGKPSTTLYKVIDEAGIYNIVECIILTGRTHQIRVHMKHIDHPVLCDDLYGDAQPIYVSKLKKKFNLSKDVEEENPILSRLALHSNYFSFTDVHGIKIEAIATLPKDMDATWKQIKKWVK
jgi:23S rRNA pseudouridine955/2504/2580 synthase/23S rRNA pseudouridine1911/1915/1917 synthase